MNPARPEVLPPLQSAGDRIFPGDRLIAAFETRDGAQQALAISERDLQLLEVLLGKIGQHVEVDAMLGEEPGVLLEPGCNKPRRSRDIDHLGTLE
jgi:hypothetical protein